MTLSLSILVLSSLMLAANLKHLVVNKKMHQKKLAPKVGITLKISSFVTPSSRALVILWVKGRRRPWNISKTHRHGRVKEELSLDVALPLELDHNCDDLLLAQVELPEGILGLDHRFEQVRAIVVVPSRKVLDRHEFGDHSDGMLHLVSPDLLLDDELRPSLKLVGLLVPALEAPEDIPVQSIHLLSHFLLNHLGALLPVLHLCNFGLDVGRGEVRLQVQLSEALRLKRGQ